MIAMQAKITLEEGILFDSMLSVYFHAASPRALPKLHQAVLALTTITDEMLQRNQAVAGSETQGMRVLEQILGNADLKTLRRIPDDFDRYLTYLLPIQEDLVRHLDPTVQACTTTGRFVVLGPGGREYLFPFAAGDYLTCLPFNQPWEAWSTLRPLVIRHHDSPQLSLSAPYDRLVFPAAPPHHVVVSLDVILLVLQYAKYLDTHAPENRLLIEDYLHRYVLYPALIQDSATIWLLHRYTSAITAAAHDEPCPSWPVQKDPLLGSFGGQFSSALEDVWSAARTAKAQNLSPPRLLTSLLMEQTSVSHQYRKLHRSLDIPPLRQYLWTQYLAFWGWRDLAFATLDLTRTTPLSKATRISTQRLYHLLRSTRFWLAARDGPTQAYLLDDVQAKLDLLDTGW